MQYPCSPNLMAMWIGREQGKYKEWITLKKSRRKFHKFFKLFLLADALFFSIRICRSRKKERFTFLHFFSSSKRIINQFFLPFTIKKESLPSPTKWFCKSGQNVWHAYNVWELVWIIFVFSWSINNNCNCTLTFWY